MVTETIPRYGALSRSSHCGTRSEPIVTTPASSNVNNTLGKDGVTFDHF